MKSYNIFPSELIYHFSAKKFINVLVSYLVFSYLKKVICSFPVQLFETVHLSNIILYFLYYRFIFSSVRNIGFYKNTLAFWICFSQALMILNFDCFYLALVFWLHIFCYEPFNYNLKQYHLAYQCINFTNASYIFSNSILQSSHKSLYKRFTFIFSTNHFIIVFP